jgi:hypothetical protein
MMIFSHKVFSGNEILIVAFLAFPELSFRKIGSFAHALNVFIVSIPFILLLFSSMSKNKMSPVNSVPLCVFITTSSGNIISHVNFSLFLFIAVEIGIIHSLTSNLNHFLPLIISFPLFVSSLYQSHSNIILKRSFISNSSS